MRPQSQSQAKYRLSDSGSRGLQLNFASLVSAEGLDVLVEVDPSSGGYYISEVILTPNDNAFSAAFPYSSFTGRHGDRCWQRNRINGWSDHGQRKHNLT